MWILAGSGAPDTGHRCDDIHDTVSVAVDEYCRSSAIALLRVPGNRRSVWLAAGSRPPTACPVEVRLDRTRRAFNGHQVDPSITIDIPGLCVKQTIIDLRITNDDRGGIDLEARSAVVDPEFAMAVAIDRGHHTDQLVVTIAIEINGKHTRYGGSSRGITPVDAMPHC